MPNLLELPNDDRWHAQPLADVLVATQSRETGLSSREAAARQAQFGPNRLPHQPPPAWWQILWRQFQSPLIYVLVAAALLAIAVGDYKDAAFIGIVLAINALIGGYQEWRAEQQSQALQKLLHIRATVWRDEEVQEIDAEELVPGDVVWLESGNRVPADLRLMSDQGLEVDESLLTGESLAVQKSSNWSGDVQIPVADRLNLAYAASMVVRGRARAVVVATGLHTVVGQLAVDVMRATGGRPPLLERMERFSRTIAWAVLAAVFVIFVIGVTWHHHSMHHMLLFSVALAVSAIPEGLPAALTVALAIATSRMARRGVIVRRLSAVEGLGSCTMIASDKTGTLTCNELTVRRVQLPDGQMLEVRGEGFTPSGDIMAGDRPATIDPDGLLAELIRAGVLCNEGDLHRAEGEWVWHGDPTDIALLALGVKAGLERPSLLEAHPLARQIPFEPENQYAATYHHGQDGQRIIVKGAPERVLQMCRAASLERDGARWASMAEALAADGYRVLGLAAGDVAPAEVDRGAAPRELTFLGLVGMIDPLRPGAREAVHACREAGIAVCMVTGDHPVTALAISRDLGLAETAEQVVTGMEWAAMTDGERRAAVRRGRVFARVAPRQKLELVEAARANGHFVAVTGDGVNDAPALRAANIGVAMGKSGTDVAREAAELVISDDNFSTLVSGVEEGRIAYDNIRKVIYLLVSTGAAEVLVVAATFMFITSEFLPLLPVQLLWLNLVTNGIQGVALAFEPGEEGILSRSPRRPDEPIFNQLMIERTLVAAVVMAAVGFAAFWWMTAQGWSPTSAQNALLLLMVLFENIHIGNCRSETRSVLLLSPLRSPFLLGGAILAFLVHVLAMHTPFFQAVLRTEPVSAATWLILIGLAMTVFAAIEIHKWTWHWRHRAAA